MPVMLSLSLRFASHKRNKRNLNKDQQIILAAALARQKKLNLRMCIDAAHPDSRPSPKQQEIFNDIENYHQRWVIAANQCKPAYSLVQMADGTLKSIAEIVEGDKVLAVSLKDGSVTPTEVTATWKNGTKDVYRYWTGEHHWTDSTPNHEMVEQRGRGLYKKCIDKVKTLVTPTYKTEGQEQDAPLELLGFLLGDGCLTKLTTAGLQFTNTNHAIIEHVRSLLKSGYHLRDHHNGDFYIAKLAGLKGENEYIQFIRSQGLENCYAHEKFIPELVFKSTIQERCKFIGGLIATDGWLASKGFIGYCTTSEKLAYDLHRLYLTLGIHSQVSKKIHLNPNHKDKYEVCIKTSDSIAEFTKLITVPGKQFKEYPHSNRRKVSYRYRSIKKVEYLGQMEVYDITVADENHTYICDGYATGNSGKSTIGGREIAWIFQENHPNWTRPERFGIGPLLLLIVGRVTQQVEIELWQKKIRPLLDPGCYKEVKTGSALTRVENVHNGNTILIMSHHADAEARDKLQSYVAHYVWLDEMPKSVKVIEEMQRRIQKNDGYFLATFTPKVRNDEIRKMAEAATEPYAKKYSLRMFDNPAYSEADKLRILDSVKTLTKEEQATILEGAWSDGDELVYQFGDNQIETPESYHYGWRHVEVVDPALKSKFGLTLWAQSPKTGIWYCVKADYIEGIYVPTEMIKEVTKRTDGYNIVRRICDTNATWFIQQASQMGRSYVGIWNKSERKQDLIKNLQEALIRTIKIAPWCSLLIDEFNTCSWSETAEQPKIVNSQRFHLLDTAQYFVDARPKDFKPEAEKVPMELWLPGRAQESAKKKHIEKKTQQFTQGKGNPWKIRSRGWR